MEQVKIAFHRSSAFYLEFLLFILWLCSYQSNRRNRIGCNNVFDFAHLRTKYNFIVIKARFTTSFLALLIECANYIIFSNCNAFFEILLHNNVIELDVIREFDEIILRIKTPHCFPSSFELHFSINLNLYFENRFSSWKKMHICNAIKMQILCCWIVCIDRGGVCVCVFVFVCIWCTSTLHMKLERHYQIDL